LNHNKIIQNPNCGAITNDVGLIHVTEAMAIIGPLSGRWHTTHFSAQVSIHQKHMSLHIRHQKHGIYQFWSISTVKMLTVQH